MPPSKDQVTRVYFMQGVYVGGTMLTSMDEAANKVAMSLHPAGVLIVGKGWTSIVPYSQIKSINLAG